LFFTGVIKKSAENNLSALSRAFWLVPHRSARQLLVNEFGGKQQPLNKKKMEYGCAVRHQTVPQG
jgi:hypothetical protein